MRTFFALIACCLLASRGIGAPEKHVLLIGGPPSHKPGGHEHTAGVLLLRKCLAGVPGLSVAVALNGWPRDGRAFDGIDAVLIYADGGPDNLLLPDDRLQVIDALARKGCGIGMLHYATEPTLEKGEAEYLRWIGGAFEVNWSVNPTWEPEFQHLPSHPILRGVQPFHIRDEWYFHLRFVPGMTGITPLLTAVPQASAVFHRPDGPHEGNAFARAAVARGESQVMAWAYERADGGRGFGYTGAHFHANWGNPNVRKLVLNAILWLAKMEVPEARGVESTVSDADLKANLDHAATASWTSAADALMLAPSP